MDIERELQPDWVGSVNFIPFRAKAFGIITCFEVLEHLPYNNFSQALDEIYRVSDGYAILSLPDSTMARRIEIWIPKLGTIKKLIEIPWIKPIVHVFNGEHYWEIGKKGYDLGKIMGDMEAVGFKIESTFRVFEYPYHRFFRLKKNVRSFRK